MSLSKFLTQLKVLLHKSSALLYRTTTKAAAYIESANTLAPSSGGRVAEYMTYGSTQFSFRCYTGSNSHCSWGFVRPTADSRLLCPTVSSPQKKDRLRDKSLEMRLICQGKNEL